MGINEIKKELLKYYTRSYEDGLMAGTSGNASILTADRMMIITPSGVDYRELTEAHLVVTTLDGEVIDVSYAPSSEWRLHAAIYRNIEGAKAVLHTHSSYATAFAVVGKPIPEILIEMTLFLNGKVPVCGFAPAGTQQLADMAADTLKTSPACLMQNHGVAAYGDDIKTAYLRATYVEDAARIYSHARMLGEPILL